MEKEISEPPLWLTSFTRLKNKQYLGDKKGDVWVCCLDKSPGWSKETKCEYCGRVCYFIPGNEDLVKENAKKICPFCAFEKHDKDIPEEMKKILESAVDDLGV